MYCTNCGRLLKEEESFCPGCGLPITEQAKNSAAGQENCKRIAEEEQKAEKKQGQTKLIPEGFCSSDSEKLCLIGLIVSAVSLVFPLFGILSVAGLVISIIGMIGSKTNDERIMSGIGIGVGIVSLLKVALQKIIMYTSVSAIGLLIQKFLEAID